MTESGRTVTTTTCAECGRTWTCDPGGDCWCLKVAIRLPVPTGPDARCHCPCKLEALAAAQATETTP